jgi:hypothetical protein
LSEQVDAKYGEKSAYRHGDVYRDVPYVVGQVESLARLLVALGSGSAGGAT